MSYDEARGVTKLSTHGGRRVEELRDKIAELHADAFAWAVACCEGRRDEAEDVLQASYLKVIDGRAKFGGQSSFKTWLFGVVRNTAREVRRRRRVRAALLFEWTRRDVEPARPTPRDAAEAAQLRETLRGVLSELSERQRQVLELVFYHDLTVEEAAEVMGVTVGTARTHYDRGKKALAARLAEIRQEEPYVAIG